MDQANYESTATQHAAIRDHFLAGGTLTPMDALRLFRCFRLAAVVHVLKKREGMNIITTMEEDDTPEGRKRWARYSLDREVPKDLQHQDPDAAFFPATTQGSLLEEGRTCK